MKRDIVHVITGIGKGGIETWLLHVFRFSRKIRDRSIICLVGNKPFSADDYRSELDKLDIPIYKIPFSFYYCPFVFRFRKLLKYIRPTVVHSHLNYLSGIVTLSAQLADVPIRIAHYHTTYPAQHAGIWLRRYYIGMTRLIENRTATNIIGCSIDALDSYDSDWKLDKRKRVLYYGIDLDPFRRSYDCNETRHEIGIPADAFVLGHVGRFDEQKNHSFLINVAAEVAKKEPRMRLLLIGNGRLRPQIEKQVAALGLNEKVTFLGVRSDVPRLMKGAMNVFVFPSLYEGLGIVLIEAQSAGLPCIFSGALPKDIDIVGNLIHRMNGSASVTEWASKILSLRNHELSSTYSLNFIENSIFNINECISKLKELYIT